MTRDEAPRWWCCALLALLTAVLHLLWLRFMLYSAKSIPLEGWYSGGEPEDLPAQYSIKCASDLKTRKTWMGPVGQLGYRTGTYRCRIWGPAGGYFCGEGHLLVETWENESLAAWMGLSGLV